MTSFPGRRILILLFIYYFYFSLQQMTSGTGCTGEVGPLFDRSSDVIFFAEGNFDFLSIFNLV